MVAQLIGKQWLQDMIKNDPEYKEVTKSDGSIRQITQDEKK